MIYLSLTVILVCPRNPFWVRSCFPFASHQSLILFYSTVCHCNSACLQLVVRRASCCRYYVNICPAVFEEFCCLYGTVKCVTEQGHCGACRRKWRLTDTDLCPCGETQTMSHIVESCPLTKLNGGLSRLHSADEDPVSWLISYGS